jgi:hypothetical protein
MGWIPSSICKSRTGGLGGLQILAGQSELARALLGLNRPTEAEAGARAAIELRPDNANIHIELQSELALLDDLNSYLKLAPKGPFADQARKRRDEVQ